MALVLNDRVKETSTTTGTGTLDLGGAATGYQTFVAGIGNSNTCYYCISAQGGAQWEVGIGTVTDASTDTLSRDTIYANSAGNTSALTLSAGTKDVFVTQPASKAVYEDNSGNISVPGTVDGVDIATRDGVLTSTTTTANAALPKAGGTMSGNIVMSSANITMSGTETVDGRDLSADGTKLDGIEASADVTDASNVSSAGALMKAGGTMSGNIVMSGSETVDGRDLSTDGTKLDGIEASADVTDATNVNAAGALMNSDLATKGTIAVGDGSGDPTILSVGTDGHFLKADSSAGAGVAWAASSASVAADEISTGDSAVTIATSSGNITIDAQADDSDIILKGTDGGADTTFLTLDGSDAGTATFNHDIILGDNSIIKLGAAPDLQIYHDTSNSIIADSGTGALQLRGSQVNLMKADGSASLVEATDGGSVELYHNGTKTAETVSGGMTVSGTLGVINPKDLGIGIHIKESDSGAGVNGHCDQLVIEHGTSGEGCGMSLLAATDGYGKIAFGDSGDNDIGQIVYNHSGNSMTLVTNAANALVIDSSGNGTFTGTVTATTFDGLLDTGAALKVGAWYNDNGSSAKGRFYFTDGGTTQINTGADVDFSNELTNKARIEADGDFICVGNITAYGSLSDEKLKENIEIIPDALDKVCQLKGVTFDYKKDGKKSTGLIAQDLQKVLPEVVYETKDINDENESYLAVNYQNTIGLLVEAIKELKENQCKCKCKDK